MPAPEETVSLPPVVDGEEAVVLSVSVLSKKTRPPPRYTEDSLAKAMEDAARFVDDPQLKKILKAKDVSGIGTVATRPALIEEIKRQGYAVRDKSYLVPTDKGMALIDWLPEVMTDVARTARWEAKLDAIAQGGLSRGAFEQEVLSDIVQLLGALRRRPGMKVTLSAGASASAASSTASTTKKGKSVADTGKRTNPPTEKMLALAEKIAERLGQKLSKDVRASFDACKEFLDSNKLGPSPKAVEFAKSIAQKKGLELDDATLADAKALSAWIDANK